MDMVVKKEIKYGENLVSQVQVLDGNKTLHIMKHSVSGEDLCMLLCEWI